MKEITRYLTFDENVFDTAEKCKEFEKNFIKTMIDMFVIVRNYCETCEECEGCPFDTGRACFFRNLLGSAGFPMEWNLSEEVKGFEGN